MVGEKLKQHLLYGAFGLLMGCTLTLVGFTDFSEVHRMFIFADFRLLFLFATTVGISMIGFAVLGRNRNIPKKSFTKGTIPGSILFGMGWAITGACPSIALVQIGEGKFAAVFTVAGIMFGVWGYRKLAAGGLKLDTGICGES
jgi:uncharacterized membrane protein YedE/YeeE